MTKEEIKKMIAEMDKPTLENVLEDVKMAKLLFLTENGKILSYIAEEYIEKMSNYSIYCKEEEKNIWTETIKKLVYKAGEVDDHALELMLRTYEHAAEVMEVMEKQNSWEEVNKIVSDQGHSGMTISLLGQAMLQYSPKGMEFTEKIIGKAGIRLLDNLNKAYKEEQEKKLIRK